VGIAPNAKLSSCRVIADDVLQLADEVIDSSYLYLYMENMHVSSNSYGVDGCTGISRQRRRLQGCPFEPGDICGLPSCTSVDWSNAELTADCISEIQVYCDSQKFENDVRACTTFLDLYVKCTYNSLSEEEEKAFEKGITEGRDGKGIIYVYAAGNEYQYGDDVNFEGALNSRYTISVSAVDKFGNHGSYSSSGSPVFVAAPGGDFEFYTNNVVAVAGGGCTDTGVGTSFAAPVVSGVVALMLEANEELSWRDVQGVLAKTSQKTDPDNPSWSRNAAGFDHSILYGFGLVDANAAVNAAKTWESYSAEQNITTNSGSVDIPIPEYREGQIPITSVVTVDASDTFITESVVVYVNLTHASRGDLNIVLTSPLGTESVLHPGQRPESTQGVERWQLMTVRNWGESPKGDWILSVVDESAGDVSECLDVADWLVTFADTDITCFFLTFWEACADGGQGPAFADVLQGFIGLTDPDLTDENGVTPDIACCECGGGMAPDTLTDMLHSWQLVVYGRDDETPIAV
jgi:subtilisin-like proprotein convertase family protein